MPYLSEAVESVTQSEGVGWELVLVNDGSTDDTLLFLESINNENIKAIHLDSNIGVAAAANEGLKYCKAPLIARMDADDLMTSDRLRKQVDWLNNHSDYDGVASRVYLMEASFDQRGYRLYSEWTNQLQSNEEMRGWRFRDSPLVNPSVMVRAELFQNCGVYKTTGPEDYEFWLRAWSKGARFGKIDEVLLKWRDHGNRLTRGHEDYSDSAFFTAKLPYLIEELRKIRRPIRIWGKGSNSSKLSVALEARGITIDSYIDFVGGKTYREKPVVSIQDALKDVEPFLLVAVKERKGTELILEALEASGRRLEEDYLFV